MPAEKTPSDRKAYKEVFKSTFLFAFVRIFQLLVGVVRNKLVAMILGPSGVGIMQLYTKTTELVKKGAGLGVSQSALRDISAAKAKGDDDAFSNVIIASKRIIAFTSLLGLSITILISPQLSSWTFGSHRYTWAYAFLSLVVFFTIRTEVQTSVLKGVRAQKHLAWSSIIGSLVGLFVSVPIFYIWGEKGIVPAMIIQAFAICLFTDVFVRKINYRPVKQTILTTYKLASPMVKVGYLLMLVGMLDSLFAVILSSFLRQEGGLDIVGLYQAGHTIMASYFGVIVTSLVMDYYPRISAVYDDNKKVEDELNKQSKIGLLFMIPLVSIFVLFAPFFINFLYTEEFECVVSFTDIAIWGAIFAIMAECVRMILIAKQLAKTYALTALVLKVIYIPMYLLLYKSYGLWGLGGAFFLDNFIQVLVYSSVVWSKYRIHFDRESIFMTILVVLLSLVMYYIRSIPTVVPRLSIGIFLIMLSFAYTNHKFKTYMGTSLLKSFVDYANRKKRK